MGNATEKRNGMPDYWLVGRSGYYERQGLDPESAIKNAAADWEEQCRLEEQYKREHPEVITITLPGNPRVGDRLHQTQVNGILYTLDVLSVDEQAPNAWHPQGITWYTCRRIHGAHLPLEEK